MNAEKKLPVTVDPFQVSGSHLLLAGPLPGLVCLRYTEPELEAYNALPESLRSYAPRHVAEITVTAEWVGQEVQLIATVDQQIELERRDGLRPRPKLRLYTRVLKDALEARPPYDADPSLFPCFINTDHPEGLPHHPALLALLRSEEVINDVYNKRTVPYLVSDDLLATYRCPSLMALNLQESKLGVNGMMVYNTVDRHYLCPNFRSARPVVGPWLRRWLAYFFNTGARHRGPDVAPTLSNCLYELRDAKLGGVVNLLVGYEGLLEHPPRPFLKLLGLENLRLDDSLNSTISILMDNLQKIH